MKHNLKHSENSKLKTGLNKTCFFKSAKGGDEAGWRTSRVRAFQGMRGAKMGKILSQVVTNHPSAGVGPREHPPL